MKGIAFELPEKTRKLFELLEAESKKVPLELSLTECEKEGQSQSEVSNLFFGSSGVNGSVEKKAWGSIGSMEFWSMKRASLEKLGRKEVKRTVWNRRMDIVTELNVFQRQYLRKGFLKVINMVRVLARIWRHKALGICPTQR